MTIRQEFAELADNRPGGCVSIGISAGEPVDRDDDLYARSL